MRAIILLACLICACDARRVMHVGKHAQGKTIQADDAATASWESNNFARYSAGELNDAELGLANFMDAVRDPSALSQTVEMLRDPQSLAEVHQLMASDSFTAEASRAMERFTDALFQEDGSEAGVREWELENVANYTAGNISLAELGATNLLAMRDPSVMEADVQMLRNPDNLAAVKKMSSLESFQQVAKLVAKEMNKRVASGNEHVPPSFAQVNEAKVQDGLETSYSPSPAKALALALGLLLSNPVAAFSPSSPVATPSRAAISMQAGRTGSKEVAKFDVKDLPGVTEPTGFFDPLGFSDGKIEEKIRFFREAELKHGRVAMLAAVGFLTTALAGNGPVLDGDFIYDEQGDTILAPWWPIALAAIATAEVYSVQDFVDPYDNGILQNGKQWLIRSDKELGAFRGGWDPLGLKPEDPEELKEVQNKELNNGRLAMIAIAGMVAQELATGQRLFDF